MKALFLKPAAGALTNVPDSLWNKLLHERNDETPEYGPTENDDAADRPCGSERPAGCPLLILILYKNQVADRIVVDDEPGHPVLHVPLKDHHREYA